MKSCKLLLIVCVIFSVVGFANLSYGVCNNWGKVVETYHVVGGNYAFYIAPNYPNITLPTYYYIYYTTDQGIVAMLSAAQSSGDRVFIFGNAASCATTGTVRNGGTITAAYRFSN